MLPQLQSYYYHILWYLEDFYVPAVPQIIHHHYFGYIEYWIFVLGTLYIKNIILTEVLCYALVLFINCEEL